MRRALLDSDACELALRLTLLLLLLQPVGDWRFRPWILLLAAGGLLLPGALLRHPLPWLALALLAGWRVLDDWPLADNHAYLLGYWCLAIGLSLLSCDPRRALARNGRLLIGLVFAFATLWKGFLSPDFLSGDFFRFTFITDDRFADWVLRVGGMTESVLAGNREALAGAPGGEGRALVEPAAFRVAVRIATWSTVALEAAVAVAFLWPGRGGIARRRDVPLLLFLASTYVVAPVAGFGWLLAAMGLAQCDAGRSGARLGYLAVFALILLYREVPWLTLLVEPPT